MPALRVGTGGGFVGADRGGSWTPVPGALRARRGGRGGSRRPHDWHTASSSAFSALQNGQNLMLPARLLALVYDLAVDDRVVDLEVEEASVRRQRSAEHREIGVTAGGDHAAGVLRAFGILFPAQPEIAAPDTLNILAKFPGVILSFSLITARYFSVFLSCPPIFSRKAS